MFCSKRCEYKIKTRIILGRRRKKKERTKRVGGRSGVELQIFYSQILRVGQSSPQQPETPSDWLRKGEIKTTVNF